MYNPIVKTLNSMRNPGTGDVITSFLIENFPVCLQAELLTHGLLSINSESSRARGVNAVIRQVTNDPYVPDWTANRPGMTGSEISSPQILKEIEGRRKDHLVESVLFATQLLDLGVHKQDANRYLAPYAFNNIIITATQWDNFLRLRTAADAHPSMQKVAIAIRDLLKSTEPVDITDGFYTPYPGLSVVNSVAKVASVSYANHNKDFSDDKFAEIYNKLKSSGHASPFCMIAKPVEPGEVVEHKGKEFIIFDNTDKELSALAYAKHMLSGGQAELLDTDNYGGFISYRRLERL